MGINQTSPQSQKTSNRNSYTHHQKVRTQGRNHKKPTSEIKKEQHTQPLGSPKSLKGYEPTTAIGDDGLGPKIWLIRSWVSCGWVMFGIWEDEWGEIEIQVRFRVFLPRFSNGIPLFLFCIFLRFLMILLFTVLSNATGHAIESVRTAL